MRITKKWILWLAVATIVLIVVGILRIPARVETVQGLTRRDVLEVKHVVRKFLWSKISLKRSYHGLASLPNQVWTTSRTQIQVSRVCSDGSIMVTANIPPDPGSIYLVRRRDGDWSLANFSYDALF
jgi:hypothetical protein